MPVPLPTSEEVSIHLGGGDANTDDAFELGRPDEAVWKIGLKAVGVFVGTFLVIFSLLASPALIQRGSYWLTHLGKQVTPAPLAFLPKLKDQPLSLVDLKNNPQDYLDRRAQLAGYSLAEMGDDQLLIPKIQVRTPIIWGSSFDEATMLANLRTGVVHYDFSALPSDGQGKVFLTGHSSYYLWDPGRYKTVFANLDKLEVGDQLAVSYRGIAYVYEVDKKEVVKPNNTSVLATTEEPTLSLMTCVPVGTSLNRLIVTSRLLSATANQPIPLPAPELQDPRAIFGYLPI